MKKLLTLLFFLAFGGVLFAQTYPLVTIEEIQSASPSPYFGDTVRVQGLTMASTVVDPLLDRRPILWAGTRWQTYLYDSSGHTYENLDGIVAIQHDTTGAAQNTFFDLVDSAQVIEITVVVEAFNETTQLALLTNPVTPVVPISQEPKRAEPIELEVTDFMDGGALVPEGAQYESMYIIIRDVITSDRDLGDGTFRINDGQGNFLTMYDQSGYFTLRSSHRLTGLTTYQPPTDGTSLNFIRGLLQVRDTGYHIIPIYPGDIEVGVTPPSISEVRRNSSEVMTNQAVTVSANIVDLDGTVDSAKLFYRVDEGSYTNMQMILGSGDTYSAQIPGVNSDSSLVDYYIWAKDDSGNVSTFPTNPVLPQFFYLVLNRDVTIQDVQYNPFGTGLSGYRDYQVTLSGIITADTSDFPGRFPFSDLMVYMQNGEGPWSGIRIGANGSLGNDVIDLDKGDNVTITGTIAEPTANSNFEVTRIDSISNIVINSSGNPLPAYMDLQTNVIGLGGLGEVEKEQWESVLIRYNNILVTHENADSGVGNYGEMLVSDGSGETRVELEDGNHSYHNLSNPLRTYYITTGSTFDALSGLLFYSHGNYKLLPRNDDDFVGFTTDITEVEEIPTEYSLSQNYPNPFNPSTTVQYSLPEAGDVTFRIYNLLGQEVKTVFNNVPQSAGNHKVVFSANELASGIYFYSFRVNDFAQVKKMILMK